MLIAGDQAPDFTLPDANGKAVSLRDFTGSKLVMWFFPKALTSGWTKEGQGFRDEFQAFVDQGIKIIGVSADPPERQKRFQEKHGFPYPLLCDEGHEMLKAYGAWGPKKMAGRAYEGIYRITYLINPDGAIFKAYPKVKPPEHAQQILEDWSS